MAGRQNKVGLDYFELDCHMDEKIELIEAEYGLKGFAIVVKLYQSIYSGFGYYCEWSPDISVLWARRLGLSHGGDYGNVGSASDEGSLPGFPKNLINDVVAASIRRNIFSKELFKRYGILTSSGIQKRYLIATSKREKVDMKKEYLLISIPENRINVAINSISSIRNSINDGINAHSRVEKSIEENIYIAHSGESRDTESLDQYFESIWKLYPVKKGKGHVSKTKKQVLQRIGYEHIKRCIDRFVDDMEDSNRDKKYWMYGSTFFNGGYVDYLDDNYADYADDVKKNYAEQEEPQDEEEIVGDDWWKY